jgi:hypothetical protein
VHVPQHQASARRPIIAASLSLSLAQYCWVPVCSFSALASSGTRHTTEIRRRRAAQFVLTSIFFAAFAGACHDQWPVQGARPHRRLEVYVVVVLVFVFSSSSSSSLDLAAAARRR